MKGDKGFLPLQLFCLKVLSFQKEVVFLQTRLNYNHPNEHEHSIRNNPK